ncbi:MAG: hypothetical protein ACI9YH_003683 [Colwellia sp.]|jgi:hypothetical protein
MKKRLLILTLFTSLLINAQGISVSDFDGEGDIYETIVLQNGNKLNFAFEYLDNNTADSDCQCEEYSFGRVLWVFETNNNFEIVKQKCFKKEDLSSLFIFYNDSGSVVHNNSGIWDDECAPKIRDAFYLDEEIVVHFLANYAGTGSFHLPTSGSQLLKFDLSTFNFYGPIHYPTYYSSSYYGVIDKTLKLNDSDLMHMRYIAPHTSDNGSLAATAESIRNNGYQHFYAQDDEFKQLDVPRPNSGGIMFLDISEIYEANTDVVILDYKKNSENNISFLVVTNALDGLYSEGVQYESALFLIEVDFTDLENLTYGVVKSDLEIPRNISPIYGDYNVFINNENKFVVNVKPVQNENDAEDWHYYNTIHILSDDGGSETISLDNEYSFQYTNANQTSVLIGNQRDYDGDQLPSVYSHKIIDIEFSQDTFVTLEEVWYHNNVAGYDNLFEITGVSIIIKLFNYDGTVLLRHIFSYGCAGLDCYSGASEYSISDKFLTYDVDDITYSHWGFGGINIHFNGITFNENTGYSIDNSDGIATCSSSDDAAGLGNPLFNLSFSNVLSINNLDKGLLEFNLKQNPVADKLIIEDLNNLDLCVFNILSQKLIEVKNTNTVDVSNLSKGVYFLKASNGVKSSTKKFIKN